MKRHFLIFMLLYLSSISAAFSSSIKIERDIKYNPQSEGIRNLLDVYYPRDTSAKKDVLVFIHGGSWNSGKKDTYWWLGRNFAGKNVVTVTINYALSPASQYEQMASDCAGAVKWVKDHISSYGGNPGRIFVMGHSAGGHLAELINSDKRFFRKQGIENPIKGLILNDGFGLDMHEYLLQAEKDEQTGSFMKTFSDDQEQWKTGSPLTYFEDIRNPHLVLVGERTYPAIKLQSKRLVDELQKAGRPVEYHVFKKKKHIGMISQMVLGGNELYSIILKFMKNS